ncbi:uncharacterized protein ARMOST_07665 [Armillaria ostoyae]|uniref:Uncharacterized protein n=1 Tax=Armillaria ostoyae TaxID=47428 RepID=A0A284R6H7_ARMOS|nr:uncharacterized protein ARMOST_07665 [Armillaria ostoyae]
MSFLFPLQCWMLLSLLLPTAMAYIVHFENHCGSGSPSVILEDGTWVDGVNSYESSVPGIVSVFLDQGSYGLLGESCSTVHVNKSGWAVGSSSMLSVPITLLYSVADHLTITFCPAVPSFIDQHVPLRFRRLVSHQVSETLWTPVVGWICGSFAVLLLFAMFYVWRSKVPELPVTVNSQAHPPLTPLPPRSLPQLYIPRSQLFGDVKLFPTMNLEPTSVWED